MTVAVPVGPAGPSAPVGSALLAGGAERRAYRLRGVVQGVGFRPHVARVAGRYPVTGFVGNDDQQVFIEVQGECADLDAFYDELVSTLPALAHLVGTAVEQMEPVDGEEGFRIVASRHMPGQRSLIPPDTSLCPACRTEMLDPTNRRYLHPFITCTECGPRLSIIRDLPYDRPATTMADFPMCPDCAREYTDPADRRFHAQPVSCWVCGPAVWLVGGADLSPASPASTPGPSTSAHVATTSAGAKGGDLGSALDSLELAGLLGLEEDPEREVARQAALAAPKGAARSREGQLAVLREARERLAAGQVLAVKGIGGFHLMCDARNEEAVARLRARKRKSAKPFAVMARDLEVARSLVRLTPAQEEVLTSPARPILIVPARHAAGVPGTSDDAARLAPSVAPGLDDLGVMLPYAPLHELLLAHAEPGSALAEALGEGGPDVLVATSGNSAAEPLTHTNAEALTRLAHLADAFLLHDRGIHVPVEDSVLMAQTSDGTEASGGVVPVRRSRGYAPLPLVLPGAACQDAGGSNSSDLPVVLGVGGEYKNTFTLAEADLAFTSAHLGDMGSLASQEAYETSVEQLTGIHRRQPDVIVHDLHPDYATTAWATRYAAAHPHVQVLAVQHHWAHALALLAEHGISQGPVVVAAVDGTGYGLAEPETAVGAAVGTASDVASHRPAEPGRGRQAASSASPWAPAPDGHGIWGGEVLTLGAGGASCDVTAQDATGSTTRAQAGGAGDLTEWERSWHVPWFPLAGGDRSVRLPWRTALSLTTAWGINATATPAWQASPAEREVLLAQLRTGVGVVPTSSLGRVFDACSALLGVCEVATYEAQAAMELEQVARRGRSSTARPASLPELVAEVVGSHAPLADRARAVHDGVAWVLAEQVTCAAAAAGTDLVGVSGGVAMNRLMTARLRELLEARGLRVLTHRRVPANDGGLSLGQAYAGRLLARR